MNRVKDFLYNFIDILLLLAILLGSAYVVYYNLDHLMNLRTTTKSVADISEDKKATSIHITIPEGINKQQLAKLLKGYHLIESEDDFIKKFDGLKKEKIKSGDFNIKRNMTIDEIIPVITN